MIRPMASAPMIEAVMARLPELPPMPATIDIRKSQDHDVADGAKPRRHGSRRRGGGYKLSSSHGARLRSAVVTGAKMSSVDPRATALVPGSSRITPTTSAMVTRSIRRPWSSIGRRPGRNA